MGAQLPPPADLSADELKTLRFLSRSVDDLLEESLRARENLAQTFRRLFPPLLVLAGAKGVVVSTRDEEQVEQTYFAGDFGGPFAGNVLNDNPWGVHRVGPDTFVSQSLDVVGVKVGAIGLLFAGDLTGQPAAARLTRVLETVAEELDTVLVSIQTAGEKQQLIVRLNQVLANRVFEAGMDQAVLTLAERVKLPGFALLYRDAVDSARLHYRIYRHGHLEHESGGQAFAPLETAIRERGPRLVVPDDHSLREVFGGHRVVEAVLISGVTSATSLGKIVVWSADGFSAYAMDLIRVLSSTLSQRLIDYNRERIHLSQFFSGPVIDELLQDPDYEARYLSPRDEEVGILFADINGFTRICELVLERPDRIGQFVDAWSKKVVDLVFEHGGVFDKMVGDCVIGLFGPPFFKSSRVARAEQAVRAAIAIQKFTREEMSNHSEVARINELVKLPGLGVAIGVNLANTYCGLFGPNRQYTGFSTGMNQTARLQSLGSFRETLVMESVRKALEGSADLALRVLDYGPLTETPVKNVAQPLRHFALQTPKASH